MKTLIDVGILEGMVKQLYRDVAERPESDFHFEVGRPVAERLGYEPGLLDRLPPEAVESFAGVGLAIDLAHLRERESMIDLGSGSGMDTFYAAELVGPSGRCLGVDFTPEQLAKARWLAASAGLRQVEFREAHIENLPVPDEQFDCVISNGVINLCPDKPRVFAEAARVLRPGGRMAVADIVSQQQLKESIVSDASLWASCIGGAAQLDTYRAAIEASGLHIKHLRHNNYHFLSERARNACSRYGVISISLLAVKPPVKAKETMS
ncbi:MAG TPA: methyltransferase type 11 [Micromonosporaceae bacterium]|nr:methyltransferase type 11 [Micromonosporaceae bacterium]HCU49477.1 methyltransferase type 11 [Micromonosporaceae bacterium]